MKVHPVVHINSLEGAVRQGEIAADAGADGVFLIDHYIENPALTFDTLNAYSEALPGLKVGVNLLGYKTLSILNLLKKAEREERISKMPDAIWVDDVLQSGTEDPLSTLEYKKYHPSLQSIRLFGGVAFKYTKNYTDDPAEAAEQASRLDAYVDVVTTSGRGTGHAPSVAKLAAMREATDKPIAVASGVSYENIEQYAGLVDEILVASSVETRPYSGVFDVPVLTKTIQRIQSTK